jgi:hypothetical protein
MEGCPYPRDVTERAVKIREMILRAMDCRLKQYFDFDVRCLEAFSAVEVWGARHGNRSNSGEAGRDLLVGHGEVM